MKKLVLATIAGTIISAITFAATPPAAVQKAFAQKFSNTSKVTWDKEGAHEYEASFVINGVHYSANFTDTGEWLETESPIAFNQLPEKVQTAFNLSNKGVTPKGVSKIETSKGISKYEVEIKKGLKTEEVFYSEEGNEIK